VGQWLVGKRTHERLRRRSVKIVGYVLISLLLAWGAFQVQAAEGPCEGVVQQDPCTDEFEHSCDGLECPSGTGACTQQSVVIGPGHTASNYACVGWDPVLGVPTQYFPTGCALWMASFPDGRTRVTCKTHLGCPTTCALGTREPWGGWMVDTEGYLDTLLGTMVCTCP